MMALGPPHPVAKVFKDSMADEDPPWGLCGMWGHLQETELPYAFALLVGSLTGLGA